MIHFYMWEGNIIVTGRICEQKIRFSKYLYSQQQILSAVNLLNTLIVTSMILLIVSYPVIQLEKIVRE